MRNRPVPLFRRCPHPRASALGPGPNYSVLARVEAPTSPESHLMRLFQRYRLTAVSPRRWVSTSRPRCADAPDSHEDGEPSRAVASELLRQGPDDVARDVWGEEQRSMEQRSAEARVLGPGIDRMRLAKSHSHKLVPFAARALLRGIDTSVLSMDTYREDDALEKKGALGHGWEGVLRDPQWPVPNLFRLCSYLPLDGVGLKVRRQSAARQFVFQPHFIGFHDRRNKIYPSALAKGQTAAMQWREPDARQHLWPTERSRQAVGRRTMAQYYDAHRPFRISSPSATYQNSRYAKWLHQHAFVTGQPPPSMMEARSQFHERLLSSARIARRSAFRMQWQTYFLKHWLESASRLRLASIPSKARLRTQLEAALKGSTEQAEKDIATGQLTEWAELMAQSDLDRGLGAELRAELGLPGGANLDLTESQLDEGDSHHDQLDLADSILEADKELQMERSYAMGHLAQGSPTAEQSTDTIASIVGIPQAAHRAPRPPEATGRPAAVADQWSDTAKDETEPSRPPNPNEVYELDLPGSMVPERYFVLTRVALRFHRHKHFRVSDHYSGKAFGLDYRRSKSMSQWSCGTE